MSTTMMPVEDQFNLILEYLEESEDYEHAAAAASDFLRRQGDEPSLTALRPYAVYLKFFSEAYRTWQISYDYTLIRSHFKLAHRLLDKKTASRSEDEPNLPRALECLTETLCEYTYCENSFINHDPYALLKHSRRALEAEKQGLVALGRRVSPKPEMERLRRWLKAYLETNRLLHRGLGYCAKLYIKFFENQSCPATVFEKSQKKILSDIEQLNKRSGELASELNAHARHITNHYYRQHQVRHYEAPTYLAMSEGQLVLSISAGCHAVSAQKIIDGQGGFEEKLGRVARQYKLDACKLRHIQLHDIFQTSFGTHFLNRLAFDLPSLEVTFLGDRSYSFDCHVEISAFGCFTIFFTLDIGKCDRVLTISEIRALESLICPHSGQVTIEVLECEIDGSTFFDDNVFDCYRFQKHVDLAALKTRTSELIRWTDKQAAGRTALADWRTALLACDSAIDEAIDVVQHREANAGTDMPEEMRKVWRATGKVWIQGMVMFENAAEKDGMAGGEIRDIFAGWRVEVSQFSYVTQVALHRLNMVGTAFQEAVEDLGNQSSIGFDNRFSGRSKLNLWKVSPDTGWYAYLNIGLLLEMGYDGKEVRRNPSFELISEHPDTIGFIIEQREARASFDDWRFMKVSMESDYNLAYIRSHGSDAFFCSEYQAFTYFPDDPFFLIKQYEATIIVMIQIDTSLKYHASLVSEMSIQTRERLEQADVIVRKQEENVLQEYLDHIRNLRPEVNEIRNLISSAGLSRYKDHGDLMQALVKKLKFDQVVGLLDSHMVNLESLYGRILERIESRRRSIAGRFAFAITALLGSLAAKDLIEILSRIEVFRNLIRESSCAGLVGQKLVECEVSIQSTVTVFLILLVFGMTLVFNRKR